MAQNTYKLLNQLRSFQKKADIGGNGNDSSFEEVCSQIAFQIINDSAPSLTPYIQGFQILERNEDDTKVLGVTGFKVNGMQLFSPLFYCNGEIKGQEMIRLADQNLWVPMKEPWLNEIFRRKPILIGESGGNAPEGVAVPDLSELIDVPVKYSAWYPKYTYPIMRDIAQSSKAPLSKLAASVYQEIDPLRHLKTASYRGICRVYGMLRDYPMLKHAFEQCHPGGFQKISAEKARRERIHGSIRILPNQVAGKKYANSVQFISYSVSISGSGLPLGLSDLEKEKLLRDGYLVQDDRRDEEVTRIVKDTGTLDSLFNPTRSGIYDVVTKPGSIRKLVILKHHYGSFPYFTVVDPDTFQCETLRNSHIWCVKEYDGKEYLKWVDSLDNEMPEEESRLFLLRGASEVYGPFYTLGCGSLCYEDTDCCCDPRPTQMGYRGKNQDRERCLFRDNKRVEVTPAGSKFCESDTSFRVPEDMRVCAVRHMPGTFIETMGTSEVLNARTKAAKVKEAALRRYEPLKVVACNGECFINNKKMANALSGLKSLIVDYGFREKTAKALLQQAERSPMHTFRCHIKRAALETPPIPEVGLSNTATLTDRVAPGPSGTAFSSSDSTDIPRSPQITVDNEYASQDVAAAQKAVELGQKDIFDVSILKSLYTDGDTDSAIDEHVSGLTRAMTEAGDLLFRFYWKSEQFKEIYGPKNLPELEGNLKKLFETLGDVVLFLKRNRLNQSDYEHLEPLNLRDNLK